MARQRSAGKAVLSDLTSPAKRMKEELEQASADNAVKQALGSAIQNSDEMGELMVKALGNKRVQQRLLKALRLTDAVERHEALTKQTISDAGEAIISEVRAWLAKNNTEYQETLAQIKNRHGLTITINDRATRKTKRYEKKVHELMPKLLRNAGLRLDTALVGPSGSGKTTAARQVADILELPFYFIACSDDDPRSRWFGHKDAMSNYIKTQVYSWFTGGGVLLIDEFDNMRANIGVTLNAMLDNALGDFPTGLEARHPDAICVAAGNTVGRGATAVYRGRHGLDESTIERFLVIKWGYDEGLESTLAHRRWWFNVVRAIRSAVADLKKNYLVTPRATINGDKLLGAGADIEETLDQVIFKDWPRDDINQVLNHRFVKPELQIADDEWEQEEGERKEGEERERQERRKNKKRQKKQDKGDEEGEDEGGEDGQGKGEREEDDQGGEGNQQSEQEDGGEDGDEEQEGGGPDDQEGDDPDDGGEGDSGEGDDDWNDEDWDDPDLDPDDPRSAQEQRDAHALDRLGDRMKRERGRRVDGTAKVKEGMTAKTLASLKAKFGTMEGEGKTRDD